MLSNFWVEPRRNDKLLTGLELLILLLLPKYLGLQMHHHTRLASFNSVTKIEKRFGLASSLPLRHRLP